ncbi:GNAT family N-acetyltransferase [Vibrio sp. 99-70-13A1]|uniref:GNAT family N-acetyltransferase n=1 Tax=Vibrio sp. 99-70-13A1 TaxID=2607601 RepID=UPI0014936ABE|nr:GNAT family N-acetyltransferase [Vibrio sp. 99-70-13A1]NOH96061.1 N-acetyltransferase [Vibrio sp. 99-70-13A1]
MKALKWDLDQSQMTVHLEDESFALIKYQQNGDVLHINSTRIPDALQGKGYGKVMMETMLTEVDKKGLSIVPVCSYVVHYMSRNPQWSHLLAE